MSALIPVDRAPRGVCTSRIAAAATRAALYAIAIAIAIGSGAAAAAEIHRCPQVDGSMRFQDRPCGPAEPAAAAPASPRAAPRTSPSGAAAAATAAVSSPPSGSAARAPDTMPPVDVGSRVAPAPPQSRREYVARNETRCRDGDRRACAAVTCERSGSLDSPACQGAVGYAKGPGWTLRPNSDLFDAARTTDEYTLTCRPSGRRTTLVQARGSEEFQGPHGAVTRAALPEEARRFCSAP